MNHKAKELLLKQGIRYPFSNQIIFSLVMHDEKRCKGLLERIFPDRKIRQVRLDVLFEDDDSWYDIECQSNLKGHLPKRSRFHV